MLPDSASPWQIPDGGANGAHGSVGTGDGRPEHRHHGVADELVERALLREDLLDHRREVVVQERDHLLGRVRLADRGEATDVREQDRDLADGAAELELLLVLQHLLGDLARHVAAQRAHEPLLLRDVVGHDDDPQRLLLAVLQRDHAEVHADG